MNLRLREKLCSLLKLNYSVLQTACTPDIKAQVLPAPHFQLSHIFYLPFSRSVYTLCRWLETTVFTATYTFIGRQYSSHIKGSDKLCHKYDLPMNVWV